MRASSKRQPAPLASRILVVVGIILIISSLLDFFILAIPLDIQNRQWLLGFISGLVDRGVVPLVGIGLLFGGTWIAQRSGASKPGGSPLLDPRFWALVLSLTLGALFLLLTPLHLNGVRLLGETERQTIEERAEEANGQIPAQVERLKQQLRTLADNPEGLQRVIESGQIPEEQLERLERLKADPGSVDAQSQEIEGQLREQIKERREQALEASSTRLFRSSITTGANSFVLAVGYLTIGWFGLKGRGSGSAKKSSKRKKKS
ncbi:MAG: HpsJ family protein [Cyanobacteria bacterium P01_D01_bin.73]